MSSIEFKQLTFGFDLQQEALFDHVDLIIDTNWKLGLIGRNGRGKTTLLKLLLGEYAYQGVIQTTKTFVYFPQTVSDPTQLTQFVVEELMTCEMWQVKRELTLLGIEPELLWRPFSSLSGGEQTKVLLALLFSDDTHFPLIDEPTNHLDKQARAQVADYLKQKKQGFLLVSHDRDFVDEVVDHIVSIERYQLVLYQGNFSVYEQEKANRDAYEQAQNEKLKKEIHRLHETAAEKARWAGNREKDKTKAKKGFIDSEDRRVNKGAVGADAARTMKRSKAIVKRIESQANQKASLLKEIETVDSLIMHPKTSHHEILIECVDLQLSYDGVPLFKPLTFSVKKGERLAIVGPNGSGKSSLLAAILGTFTGEITGEIKIAHGLQWSLIRQLYEDNQGSLEAFAEQNQIAYQDLLHNLRKLGIERETFQQKIETMSMGQRKRVEVAYSLIQEAEVFIWDEPLNYLDVFNHSQIEEVILRTQPTMLVIEHDRRFIETIATTIIDLDQESD